MTPAAATPEQLRQHERWIQARQRIAAAAATPKQKYRTTMVRSVEVQDLALHRGKPVERVRSEPEKPLPKMPTAWKSIVTEVAAKHGISVLKLLATADRLPTEVVRARHEAIVRIYRECRNASQERIGAIFGRDRTSVNHVLRQAREPQND